ncbi:putative secondary metabolism biosynthetic enzyme, partial [Pyricularia oryzae]
DSAAAVILAGSDGPPPCFSAGLDITELASLPENEVMESLDLLALTLNTGIFIPLIAAVGGTAVGGGCELALACDIVYTTKHASFALPEVRLGLLAAGGGVRRLPGAVGAARAANLLLTGKAWSGAEAVSWGMAIEACDTWKDCLNP